MSAAPQVPPTPRELYGLDLVDEPAPRPASGGPAVRTGTSLSLASLAVADWVVLSGFVTLLLGYLVGLGLCLRWVLRWLVGA